MKQYTSRFLKAVAVGYMAFPVLYSLFLIFGFDVPARSILGLAFAPTFIALNLGAIASGFGLWEMRRWAWYIFLPTNIFLCVFSANYINQFSESPHPASSFSIFAVFVALVVYKASREIRVPYFFPKIRWWESDPRYKLSVPVDVNFQNSKSGPISGQIMDLSMGGCFMKVRADVVEHAPIRFAFKAFGLEVVGEGVVVWCTRGSVTHPQGLGIKFIYMERDKRRALKLVTQRLRKITSFYRKSRYLLNQEEFLKRLEELETGVIESSRELQKKEA